MPERDQPPVVTVQVVVSQTGNGSADDQADKTGATALMTAWSSGAARRLPAWS
jgi:hypothetical protein